MRQCSGGKVAMQSERRLVIAGLGAALTAMSLAYDSEAARERAHHVLTMSAQ
jgi:ribonucleoside-diphosphate reductase alpha chain